ncbi:integrase core domain-containing protein [Pirellulaceae bacterium SH501]
MKYWTERSELPCKALLKWANLSTSKYHKWLKRYGKINLHNGKMPRDWWLEEWEKQAILDFHDKHPLTHVRTSPYYPQSNGKLERWHGSLKSECIRPGCPATKQEAENRISKYVSYYNTVRLHSAIGYITPADCLAGLSKVIGEERDRKLEAARKLRQEKRAAAKQVA